MAGLGHRRGEAGRSIVWGQRPTTREREQKYHTNTKQVKYTNDAVLPATSYLLLGSVQSFEPLLYVSLGM